MNLLRIFRRVEGGVSGPLQTKPEYRVVGPVVASAEADLVPNVVNWVDISSPQAGPWSNNVAQVTGISERILLSVSWPGSSGTVYCKVSSASFSTGDYTLGTPGWNAIATTGSFYVEPNHYVGFVRVQNKPGSVLLTVINRSDGGVTLDTFATTMT
jgi:hypothetical protein